MLVKVFSLKFDPMHGKFDDTPVRDFSIDKEILHISDHMLVRNEIPYLVLVIKYYPFRKEAAQAEAKEPDDSKESWKKEITAEDMPLFNRLRDWRSEQCKKDGVPPYLIFTNRQFAEIVKIKPQTVAELGRIEGVGRGKIERYADSVLQITKVKTNE